jgi:trans-AT polyketide synthase/acyltransferase/oxidoreductase domain-containing protein
MTNVQVPGTPEGGKKVCFLFSGQGSQYRQMGRELYDGVAAFRGFMDALDHIVCQETGRSLLPELYGDQWRRSDPFDQTGITHPALFMLQLSLARTLMAQGLRADAVLGSSLGEYVAAVVAGAVDGDAMMRAIVRSAHSIEQDCEPGAMLSVLAPRQIYDDEPWIRDATSFVSSYQTNHFVIAGALNLIKAARDHWDAADVVSVLLPVAHAFHSEAMNLCADSLRDIFGELFLEKPHTPFYSSLLGGRVEALSAAHFLRVGREPIHFIEALNTLLGEPDVEYDFIDLGPSGSLAGIVKQYLPAGEKDRSFALLSLFSNPRDQFERLMAQNLSRDRF